MTTASRRSKPNPSEQEINRTLEAGIYEADEERARLLQGMRLVQAARVQGGARHLRRLSGVPDIQVDRARTLADRLQQDRRLERALRVEATRARLSVPDPDPGAWILYGHVLDEGLDPVPDVSVVLAGTRGEPVKAKGGSTDASGYFKVSVAALPAEPAAGGSQPGVADKSSRRASQARPDSVTVRVLAGRSKVLFEDDAPLAPVAGGVEYTEIVLPETRKPSSRRPASTSRGPDPGSTQRAPRKANKRGHS